MKQDNYSCFNLGSWQYTTSEILGMICQYYGITPVKRRTRNSHILVLLSCMNLRAAICSAVRRMPAFLRKLFVVHVPSKKVEMQFKNKSGLTEKLTLRGRVRGRVGSCRHVDNDMPWLARGRTRRCIISRAHRDGCRWTPKKRSGREERARKAGKVDVEQVQISRVSTLLSSCRPAPKANNKKSTSVRCCHHRPPPHARGAARLRIFWLQVLKARRAAIPHTTWNLALPGGIPNGVRR
jgi:hypothetical protein